MIKSHFEHGQLRLVIDPAHFPLAPVWPKLAIDTMKKFVPGVRTSSCALVKSVLSQGSSTSWPCGSDAQGAWLGTGQAGTARQNCKGPRLRLRRQVALDTQSRRPHPAHWPMRYQFLHPARSASLRGRTNGGLLSGCRRLKRRYECKPEHFLAFGGLAATLIWHRRLAK